MIARSDREESRHSPEAVTTFQVAFPQAALDDLKRRLADPRWPNKEPVSDWSQGLPLANAQRLIAYWRDVYDWRACETRLNSYPQFRTEVDSLGFHFIHVRSAHENALPIILTHGWPGSVIEFLKTIGPLTDPTAHGGRAEDAFHVVIPSLPGFGFSDQPKEIGWDVTRTAKAWHVLMERLGYSRWVAQGGDWGSAVTTVLAQLRPSGLVAAHVNWPFVIPVPPPQNPTPGEKRALDAAATFFSEGSGYFRQQATRPQTLAYGLADSPAGQAAWIYEKFWQYTDHKGDPEDALSMDEMLDNITLYWLTNSAGSSARFYWENTVGGMPNVPIERVELPMAASIFPREIFCPPKQWADALWPNIIHWNELDRGGHFAAFEEPKLFVEELRRAFASVRG